MINQPGKDLIKKLKQSDKYAFEQIFNAYYDSVFKNIFFKIKDYELARDITQETFIKCWENRNKIDDTKSFYFWIITIASNLTTNQLKREQMKIRHHDVIKSENSEYGIPANEQIEADQLQQQIDDIVSKYLAPKCQTIFIMSRFEGKSNAEIAETLSISKKTVENQLYEALKTIKSKLKKVIGVSNYTFVLL